MNVQESEGGIFVIWTLLVIPEELPDRDTEQIQSVVKMQ